MDAAHTPTIEEFDRPDRASRLPRVEELMLRMLRHLTPDPHDPGIAETPQRVAKMWLNELTVGYDVDVESLIRLFPDDGYKGMVVVQDIPVTSVCMHHLVPIVGYAHIAYFPDGHVIGLSKLPRIVDAFARRLQIQERLTRQVHDTISEHLSPRGTMVVLDCEHLCMTVRGVQKPGTRTATSEASGLFIEPGVKEEFFRLIGGNH